MKELRNLLAGIELFRGLDGEFPAQTMATLLVIALEPQITMTKLAERLGIAQSSVTRNVYKISTYKRPGLDGLGLVAVSQHATNFREKVLTLTGKGERFLASVSKALTAK